ncbi:MAG TPA: hypothetical protein V6D15_16425 [Oculatellaceae cyanobacterium]
MLIGRAGILPTTTIREQDAPTTDVLYGITPMIVSARQLENLIYSNRHNR